MGWENGFRLYLSALVLVPLGVTCILLGWGLSAQESQVAITLVVLGAGMLVFGAFGPRMEGPFKIGAAGAEGGLSPAALTVAAAAVRLREAADKGEIAADEVPKLQEMATVMTNAAASSPA